MNTRRIALAILSLGCAHDASAGWVVTKIADGIPDMVAPMPVAVLRSEMAYADSSTVYFYKNGSFTRVLELSNPVFGGTAVNIDFFSLQLLKGGRAAFLAIDTENNRALFLANDAGQVTRLVPPSVVVSGVTHQIRNITSFSINGDDLAFSAWGYYVGGALTNTASDGLYLQSGGVVNRLMGPDTVLPGMDAPLLDSMYLALGPKSLAFVGRSATTGWRLDILRDGQITKLLGVDETLPGQSVSLLSFRDVSSSFGKFAFVTMDSMLRGSVYRYYQDTITPIIVPGQALPDNQGALDDAYSVAFDGGNVAFISSKRNADPFDQEIGLFAWIGNRLWTVVSGNELFDGREPYRAILGRQSFSGNAIVFGLQFRDGGSSLYRAELVFGQGIPSLVDLDGDNQVEPALFDPDTSTWFTRYWDDEFTTLQFGYPGVQPATADYDGDGIADTTVYDPRDGHWYMLQSQGGFHTSEFGYYGTVPVPADYDGDGLNDQALYDTSSGWWYILGSTDGFRKEQFGYYGTSPIPADFDNDGRADIAVYEHAHGLWYIHRSSANDLVVQQFGYDGVDPVPVDFDGGGADYAVFDPRNGQWYSHGQVEGFQLRQFGYNGVRPVSADYDGDAKSDLGVYDPRNGTWYLLRTAAGFRSGGL